MAANLLVGAAAMLAICIYRLLQSGKRDPRMPPGPPTIPILGNLHILSTHRLYKQFKELSDKYGGIYSLKFGSANVIVISDRDAVYELLDRRGLIFADRPQNYISNLILRVSSFQNVPNNALLREKRKSVAYNLSPQKLNEKHSRLMDSEAVVFLNDMLEKPELMYDHVRRYTASVIGAILYGHRASTFESPFGRALYDTMDLMIEAQEPGANPPFDEFPFLKYIPERWNFWKRRAIAAKQSLLEHELTLNTIVEKRRANGDKRDCIADNLSDRYEKEGWLMSVEEFSNNLREVCEAGGDTSAGQLRTLILAFATHPHVVMKAQAEIDRVCGPERAPTFSDFRSLPYINCIIKEGLRWRPVAPLGLPHQCKQDETYKGMLIPKDSTIFVASYALNFDKRYFKDPDSFNPGRFAAYTETSNHYTSMPGDERDHYSYGVGRRSCPGIYLAERNQWTIAAKLLWAFNFFEPLDPKTGEVVPLDTSEANYESGLVFRPRLFDVRMVPRSSEHAASIARSLAEAKDFLATWE